LKIFGLYLVWQSVWVTLGKIGRILVIFSDLLVSLLSMHDGILPAMDLQWSRDYLLTDNFST
jgi:hypothetical protein